MSLQMYMYIYVYVSVFMLYASQSATISKLI